MKISIAIAFYFGRRDGVPNKYQEDILHFAKVQISNLEKSINSFHKIYFVYTYDENTIDVNHINSYFYELLEKYPNLVILSRPNLGGSYAGWHNVLEFDKNESDYMVFVEDDYAIEDGAVERMLEYYSETPDMIYLCQLWNTERYTKDGMDITGHAQISNGMINIKLYNELKEKRGLDFTLYYYPGKICIFNNQVSFLEQYKTNGIKIRDMKEKYSCVFNAHRDVVVNFCNANGADIFKPITDWYPNHCPNMKYTW